MKITVFTPTFNRGHLLRRVYASLLNQTNTSFEWLIVDDGSTDNTSDVVRELMKEELLDIRFIQKENGGKHTAHNEAVKNATGDMFLCLDSDDQLMPGALSIIQEKMNLLQESDCGFVLYKCTADGKLLCNQIEERTLHSSLSQLVAKHGMSGEYAFVFVTAVLKQYMLPEYTNECFLGESVLYDRMELDGYTLCPVNEVLELCEYQAEGLSSNFNKLMKNNPAGYCLYFMQRVNVECGWKRRIVAAGKYHCFCIFAGEQKTMYSGGYSKTVMLSKPLGLLFWVYYKLVRGF